MRPRILAELAISPRSLSIQGDNVELLDKNRSWHSDVNSFQGAEIGEAVAGAKAAGGYIGNVLRSEFLSVGVYVLPAGGTDPQKPHAAEGRPKRRGQVDAAVPECADVVAMRARTPGGHGQVGGRLHSAVTAAERDGREDHDHRVGPAGQGDEAHERDPDAGRQDQPALAPIA